MGAFPTTHTFEAPNEKAAVKVAEQILDSARYEGGHDPYAGHIGTCSGVRVYRTPRPLTAAQADALCFGPDTDDMDAPEGMCEKWGPAILIRIRNKGSRRARWALAGMAAE